MRLRNVKNAQEILEQSPYFLKNPEHYLGNMSSVFSKKQPLYLEIGCGKGQFFIQMAKRYPNVNFIGMEKYNSVLVRAIEKANMEELPNLKFICMDAKEILSVFQKDIEVLYLNFSDPWPKKRHHERRLTSSSFLCLYDAIFVHTPHIIQKTDHPLLFASSLEDLSKHGYFFQRVSLNLHETDIPNVVTEYEERFMKENMPIYYLEAFKREDMEDAKSS